MYLRLSICPGYIYLSFVRLERGLSPVLELLMQVILPYLISVRLFVVIPSEPGHYEPSSKELPLDFVPWQY